MSNCRCIGPSTDRDTVGKVVDLALNPLGYVLDAPEKLRRHRCQRAVKSSMIAIPIARPSNSILYDSADSYAQARILYLQHRRYELAALRQAGRRAATTISTPTPTDPKLYPTQEAKQ